MSESQGQIHGLISREQMHDMWLPYGERLTVNSEVSDDPTPSELVNICFGAEIKDVWAVADEIFPGRDYPKGWQPEVIRFLEDGGNNNATEILLESYDKQLEAERMETEQILVKGLEYLAIFSKALGDIALDGVVTDDHVDLMRSRLFDKSGSPFMQEAPMTLVRLARHWRLISSEDKSGSTSYYATDFNFGLLWHGLSLNQKPAYKTDNRSHELVHSVQGLEIYDISTDEGRRAPVATAVGHFKYPPSTEVDDASDFSIVENSELCEGWVQYVNNLLHSAEPRLGELKGYSNYDEWAEKVAELHHQYPGLFQIISDTSIAAEAAPANPTAKKDALAGMHEAADKELGVVGALDKYMAGEI